MTKINFQQISDNEKANIYKQIGEKIGIPAFAAEKDWWVVKTLSIIFEMDVAENIIFKGGTSLSKAWKLIERFSEDIDLAIDREFLGYSGELSKNQRTELRKAASVYTSVVFFDNLKKKFEEKELFGVKFSLIDVKDSDQDPRIIEVYYPNIIDVPGYLQPRVQIEMGCRSLREPFILKEITSLVDELYADKNFAQPIVKIPTVNPERTFLEKLFLLHEEFHKPKDKIRVDRLSRHLYDIYHLAKTDFAINALNNKELYEIIVKHRYKYTRIGGVNYNLLQPQTLNPIPVAELMDAWKADYKTMTEQMIYEQYPPTFDEIINELIILKKRINNIEWHFEVKFPF